MSKSVWLDEWDATRHVKRSPRTLHRWRTEKKVKAGRSSDGRWMFDLATLDSALAEYTARQLASKIHMQNRRYGEMAGPGRGHKKVAQHEDQLDLF